MAHDSDDRGFTPPPLSSALVGHLATGLFKAAAIAVLLWLLGLIGLTEDLSLSTAIMTAAVVMISVELATTGVERFFVLRHQHPDPGSIPMTVIVASLPLPIGLLVGLLTTLTLPGALVTMAVTAAVYWSALVALERPWVAGDTAADIRRKFEETKAMTRDRFRPE